ncbi:excinuclease ABC subunit UvrA [Candidatus Dojkabacteria bacterium]|nr:excinuclease ABC subunit UvrA [Candidatus Dojkabacteria bacterium]
MEDYLIIKGAREHNLKNIDVKIPKNTFTVITGLSGSGKSSLAFDTIYAEGQRRYVESLSAYARQFLGMMRKPDVDYIQGLSPAISIDQKSASHNPRSTVGTVTEIYDYLRLLFARAGHPRCPNDDTLLQAQTVQEIVDSILDTKNEIRLMIMAPVIKNRKGTYEELFQRFLTQGYVRVRVDGHIYSLEEDIKLDKFRKHNIEVVIDRLSVSENSKNDKEFIKRVTDSVETALNLAEGEIIVSREKVMAEEEENNKARQNTNWEDKLYSEKFVCPLDGTSFPQIEPHTFSFNSPYGACPKCNGLGYIQEIDRSLVYNPNLTIAEGGIYPWSRMADNHNSWMMQMMKAVAIQEGFSLKTPLKDLKEKYLNLVLYGSDRKYSVDYKYSTREGSSRYETNFEGVIPNLMRRYGQTDSDYIRKEIEKYMRNLTCPECGGKKLKREALAVTILNKNIIEVGAFSINDLVEWFCRLMDENSKEDDRLSRQAQQIVKQVVKEILERLNFLLAVGLDYLTLNRRARTLSGGESQRIRLASQIGSGLSGVMYVLDEPSIGLHQRDNERLLGTLLKLRDLGNTVLVVEHDEDTIRHADHIVDVGPGAGEHGGKVVAQGTLKEIINTNGSITGEYLSEKKKITKQEIMKHVKTINGSHMIDEKKVSRGSIFLHGANHHNLKNINVEFPLGKFIAVTGVSGSGKSTLINDTLYRALAQEFYNSKAQPGKYSVIEGIENIDKVIAIDQSPIGRTPRSNPATYVGLFTPIRELFSKTKEARVRGYGPGRFSFNVKGGRCENCKGDGVIKIEMQFLPEVYIECEVCHGKRYNREALQIDYKGKSISNVLDMTVEEALEFFQNIPSIGSKLTTLHQVGLSYIKLGQPATTLSGGEAQRVKLSTELSKRSTGKTLFILDEPTTGLHFEDVRRLLIVLHSLVNKGNTVIVIEHNLDVIKTADWIIDLGPEGGEKGGEVIATGTVEEIMKNNKSYTGEWIKKNNK